MKNRILLFASLIALQSCTIVDSSEVGVVVDQIGTDKGEPHVEIKSGFIFYFPPTQDVFKYPTSVQHKVWTADLNEDSPTDEHIDVTSSDGATFGLDVALNFQMKRDMAGVIFKKYRVDMDEMVKTRIKTIVRKDLLDNAVLFASDSLLQHRNKYENAVSKSLTKSLDTEGYVLNNIAIIKMAIPESYRKAIELKIRVIQETATVNSQTIKAEAMARQKVATAKGDFESAQYEAQTKQIMSQPKMIELYKAETDRIWASKGVSPFGQNNVLYFGNSVPNSLLNLRR